MFPDELLDEGEHLQARFRSSFGELAAPITWAVVVSLIAFIYTEAAAPGEDRAAVTTLAVLVWTIAALALLVRLGRWAFSYYVVTNERILWRTGLFSQRTSEIRLAKIDSIQVRAGLLDRLRGSGDLVIRAANWSGDIAWRGVPGVKDVHMLLSRLVKADREAERPPAAS